jgi:hypothetical protein
MTEKKKRPGRPENLNPVQSKEEAMERGRAGGIKSGEARRKKKLMSEMYAEFLADEFDIKTGDGTVQKVSGQVLVNQVVKKVLARGDGSSVNMLREMREATEGSKLNVDMSLNEEQAKEIQDLFGVEMNEFNKSRPAPTGKQKAGSEDN